MPKLKGGRGLTAPYKDKLMRIPLPLADQVEELKERYRDFLDQGGDPLNPPPLLDAIADDKPVNEFDLLQESYKAMNSEMVELKNNFWLEKKSKEILEKCAEQQNKEIEWLKHELTKADKLVNRLSAQLAEKQVDVMDELAELVNELEPDQPVNELEPDQPVNELEPDQPVNKIKPLNQQQLARLFGLSHTAIGKQKLQLAFTEWSRQYDPSGKAWRYDQKAKLFYPVD